MKTPPQWDCPKQETGEDILAWAERVNRWAGYNLVEAHYADGLAGYLTLCNENRLEIRAAVLTQVLCASHQQAYLAELNKPIFVPLNPEQTVATHADLMSLVERCLEYVYPVFDPKAHQLYSDLRKALGKPIPEDEL